MEEKSCFDMLNTIAEKVESSSIPYQQKRIIVDEINVLWQMLWPWTDL